MGSYGDDNGKGEKHQEAVDKYNTQNESVGSKAVLQWYESVERSSGSEDEDVRPASLKKKRVEKQSTPMILALCTLIMQRAHLHVQQSRDV